MSREHHAHHTLNELPPITEIESGDDGLPCKKIRPINLEEYNDILCDYGF